MRLFQRAVATALALSFSLANGVTRFASAQDASPPATASPATDPLPEIPETIVPGRTGSFPAEPLTPDTILSATNTPAATRSIGSSYTVIDSEKIAASQQQNVAEVLRGTPGLDVVRQGGPGGVTTVFLRGANSQQTKVLIDGVPVNDPSNASRLFDFSNLSTDNIERIEVIRGPQSVLYGSDAIGGVVNIITKRGQGPFTAKVGAMGGTYGTHQETVSASGGDERTYYALGGSFLKTDGISSASRRNGNREPDGYSNGSVSGRFGWNPDETWNVDYMFRYTDARAELDDFSFGLGVPVDNLIRRNISKIFTNRVQLTNLAVDGLIEQKVGFSLTDYNRLDTDSGPFSPPLFVGQTRKVDYQASLQLTDSNTFTAGTSYQHEDGSSTFNPLASLTDIAFYLQDQFQLLENWSTTVGVRWDDYNRAGPAQTYRVASVYRFDESATSLHGSLGTGFRAPALAESLFAFGNPNLRPESSKGWDAGVRQELVDGTIVVDATVFDNFLNNLIVFDFNTFNLENVGRARTTGAELSGMCYVTERVTLTGGYTFTNARNLDTGVMLLRRPREKSTIGLEYLFPNESTRVGINALLVGQRLDTGNNILARYTLVNLTARQQLGRHSEFFLRVDNLFNESYEEVRGYGVPGVATYAGFNLTY